MFTQITKPVNHPGRVTMLAADGTETVHPADSLPEWMTFIRTRDGQNVPVVMIARVRNGIGFTLRSYGTDGRLLAVSISPDGSPVPPPLSTRGWF